MHVARPQPDPVHRGQVADRIALVVVLHQLRARRGARGEIQQQRIGGPGWAVRREGFGRVQQRVVAAPAGGRVADGDAGDGRIQPVELRRIGRGDDQVAHAAAVEPVLQVARGQQRGGGDHHGAKLHGGQHGFPQRHDIAEHQQDAVAALDAEGAEAVGQAARRGGEFGEAARGGTVAGDVQRGLVGERAAGEFTVEPVQGVVEGVQFRPAEIAVRGGVVGALREQEVAGCLECVGGHRCLPAVSIFPLPLQEGVGGAVVRAKFTSSTFARRPLPQPPPSPGGGALWSLVLPLR